MGTASFIIIAIVGGIGAGITALCWTVLGLLWPDVKNNFIKK